MESGEFLVDKDIVVIFHGKCVDGFGSAWVLYKKFGDNANYFPAEDRLHHNLNLENKEVYICDYSYPEEVIMDLEKVAKKLTMIDHHISAKETILKTKNHLFDIDHSGAYLTWKYIFPEEKAPKLIQYIEDQDLYRFSLPDSRPIASYISFLDFDFSLYGELAEMLEDEVGYNKVLEKGNLLKTVHDKHVDYFVKRAELVNFNGYEIYAVNANNMVTSDLGHKLSQNNHPFALIFNYEKSKWKCSLRGDGTVDLSLLAKKYGGGGHHNASGFILDANTHPLNLSDITRINKDE